MEPKIEFIDKPAPEIFKKILAPLLRFNAEAVGGKAESESFAFCVPDPDTGDVGGGLWARVHWGFLYIDLFFLPEPLRRGGLGSKLLRMAEDEGVRRGCHTAWLDTFNFQARPFYERLGYTVFGTLDGEPPAFPRFFMKKALAKS
jgi:GNAT superfamily N-acetyltransferase